MTANDEFWSDYFHSCAIIAYMEVSNETGQIPPDSEAVRQRAHAMYEEMKRNEIRD